MRAFIRIRETLQSHKDLTQRSDELEAKYDRQFGTVFDAIRQLSCRNALEVPIWHLKMVWGDWRGH